MAVLVCLQELHPSSFALVQDNPDCLEGFGEQKSHHRLRCIIAGLGPVSATTADVLITKQNEPSLKGCSAAHSLPAAVRADDCSEILKILKDVEKDEQEKLLAWLGRKLRDTRSSARFRQMLGYVVDFGDEKGLELSFTEDTFHKLKKARTFFEGRHANREAIERFHKILRDLRKQR